MTVLNKVFLIFIVALSLLGNSCVFGAYTTIDDLSNSVQQRTVEDMLIQIEGLESDIRVLELRQSYLEEMLISILESIPEPFNFDSRKEEVNNAI